MQRQTASRESVIGSIGKITKYAIHDGPGIRTAIFFKGCPLRCLWCCNPELQTFQPQILWLQESCINCSLCVRTCASKAISEEEEGRKHISHDLCDFCRLCVDRCPGEALQLSGRYVTVDEILREIGQDAIFYQRSAGGITLTGGEPLSQPDFAYELLRRYKTEEKGLHASIETCGHAEWSTLSHVLKYVDLVLLDLKHMNSQIHQQLTGVGNELILDNASRMAKLPKKIVIRVPVVVGYNDDEENIEKTAAFARSLTGVEELDILPYHRLGEPKYKRLGKEYPLQGTVSCSPEHVDSLRKIVERYGLRVKIGG